MKRILITGSFSDNPARAAARRALQNGHLTPREMNQIRVANIDPLITLHVDETKLKANPRETHKRDAG